MRSVLFAADSLDVSKGGPSQNVALLAAALSRQGTRVAVVSFRPGNFHGALAHAGVATFMGSGGPAQAFFDSVLERFRPEVVHDNGIWLPANHAVAGATAVRGIARIVSPRGMLEAWAMQAGKFKKRLAWALYQRRDLRGAACLVATSPQEAASIAGWLPGARVAVVPNGWSAPEAAPAHRPSGSPRRALFFSRIHPKKGVELLLRAWAQVRPAHWRLEIVGPGEVAYVRSLEAAAASLGIDDSVAFGAPEYDEHAKNLAIGSADLVVLPSFSENFGSIIVEALGLGVPVITTTATPWDELPKRRAGWWVEPTQDALAAALREAVALDDVERAAMGRRGSEWVRSDFSWKSVAERMMLVYEEVLGRSR
ncbi:glycosyltransferase [Ramlibacter sp. PS4R-6]|uniref:glycosyltransferase n=1 Tax=Ramlibacter sp. PS4R-6 TaxID=3133438 RepID=UPI00309BA68C